MIYTHLVIYKGGGYDGCIWEYNAFLASFSKGRFTSFANLFASGYDGIETIEQANAMFANKSWRKTNFSYFVKIGDTRKVKRIVEEIAPSFLVPVFHEANKIITDDVFFLLCDSCGCEIYHDASLEDVHGCGANNVYCEDCHSMHSCGYCGKFHDENDWQNNIFEVVYHNKYLSVAGLKIYAPENANIFENLYRRDYRCVYCMPKGALQIIRGDKKFNLIDDKEVEILPPYRNDNQLEIFNL